MKILYISFSKIPSQTANSIQVMQMSKAFHENDHEIILIAKNNSKININPFDYYGLESSFKLIRINVPNIKFNWIIYTLFIIPRMFYYRPNIIFSRDSFSALIATILRFNVIFEAHSIAFGRDNLIYKLLFKMNRLKLIVVISKVLKTLILSNYPKMKKKIIVAPDAVSHSWFDMSIDKMESRKQLGYGEKDFVVGYSGSLYKGRGIELILEVAKRCLSDKFLIIGGPEEEKKRFVTQAEYLGLSNIQFMGYTPNSLLPKYLFSCDILLMPYQATLETAGQGPDTSKFMSPLKMFEYLATGNPIISSDLPVLKEVLTNNYNALLVPPSDINEWVQKIRLIKDNYSLSKQLGNNGLKTAKIYQWVNRANEILNSLNKIKNSFG